MKIIFKLLATLVTGIGGHYLNRRWDRAVLFLSLFVAWSIGLYIWLTVDLMQRVNELQDVTAGYASAMQYFTRIFAGGVAALWLLSLLVTWRDARKNRLKTIRDWTVSGLVAALLTTGLSTAFLYGTVSSSIDSLQSPVVTGTGTTETAATGAVSRPVTSDTFYTYLNLGGSSAGSYSQPPPPNGSAPLVGRIVYDGKPAAGVIFSINLNGRYRVKGVETDSEGVFAITLPAGTWYINSIQTKSWAQKPEEGKYSLHYEGEERLKGDRYNRYAIFNGDGYKVDLVEGDVAVDINLKISKRLDVYWPHPQSLRNEASLADVISWEGRSGASNYYVEVNRLSRDGDTTTYRKVASRVQSESLLPLADLQSVASDGEPQEYAVKIYAFDADGAPIAVSPNIHRKGSFFLTDGHVLVEERESMSGGAFNAEAYKAQRQAVQQLQAVEVMIDEKMLKEAQILLDRVDSKAAQGKKEVLLGYLLTLCGECEKAKVLFEQATVVNPEVCISPLYK